MISTNGRKPELSVDVPAPPWEWMRAEDQARAHLSALFPWPLADGEYIELRALDCSVQPAALGPRLFCRELEDLIAEAMRLKGQYDVFIGVGTRRCHEAMDINDCPHRSKSRDHVYRIRAAWADLDVESEGELGKPYASLDEVQRTLERASVPPSLIVSSGHGAHSYWLLAEPEDDLDAVEAANRGIRDSLDGDNAVDAGRVLRLAGTTSHKHGQPLPVGLLSLNGFSKTLEQLRRAYPPRASEMESARDDFQPRLGQGVTDRYQWRLQSLLRAHGGKYERYLSGKHDCSSDSEAWNAVIWAAVARHMTDDEIVRTLEGSTLWQRRAAKHGEGHIRDRLGIEIEKARRDVAPFERDPGEGGPPDSKPPADHSPPDGGAPAADPVAQDDGDVEIRLTDTGNGHRLINDNQGDLLWCQVFKRWFVWDGTRYAPDDTQEVERRAERTVRRMYEKAAQMDDVDSRQQLAAWAQQSESRHRISSMVESAKRMAPVHPNEFDADPMIFNVRNGTIDLRTQKCRPHARADRLRKRAGVAYDPAATCPLWLEFLGRIFERNDRLVRFVQRLFGYCLTGLLEEHIIIIFFGSGSNGKTTLLHILRLLAGDYAHHCRPEVFMAKRGESQGFELVPLAGARVVTATETGSGRRLDEALVKEMTGGEPVTCAPKYGDFFTFQPQFKPLLATNHKPQIKGVNEGIWRRLKLLPFTVTIPEEERDKKLPEKLEAELPGILNWALTGLADYLSGGLQVPPEIEAATGEYRAEQDVLANWMEENCDTGSDLSDEVGVLYDDYVSWCEANKEEPVSKKAFGSLLDEHGHAVKRGTKGRRMRQGIARKKAPVG